MAGSVKWEIWPYTPSAAGGAIGCIVFALLTGFHAYRLFRNRTWFCIPFVIGGLVSNLIAHKTPFPICSR